MKTIGERAIDYMAEAMDLHNATGDEVEQGQNQLARHMAQFGERERKAYRRAIAWPLRELRRYFGPGPNVGMRAAIRAIDRVTRAPMTKQPKKGPTRP